MTNFTASIPVALMAAANATLEGLGYGPNNFSVPAYTGAAPSHALLHCWPHAEFEAAVTAIAGVVIQKPIPQGDGVNDSPMAMIKAVAQQAGANWAGDAKPLTGVVTPGLYYDDQKRMWYVYQQYNTATYPDPAVIPALILPARVPGEAAPWVQPYSTNPYKKVNPFTGDGDLCVHNDFTWRVTQADGNGNNVWEPGVFGWTKV